MPKKAPEVAPISAFTWAAEMVPSVVRFERRAPSALKNAWVLAFEAAMKAGSGSKRMVCALLRIRVHSVELKKNILSFLIGPPTEYPNWLRVKTLFLTGLPVAGSMVSSFSGVFEARAETRLNSYRLRWYWLPPALVATVTTPRPARPYSAVKILVRTLNTCT